MRCFASAVVILLIAALTAHAETVHQSLPANRLSTGDGANAVTKEKAETKEVDGAESTVVTRVKGTMNQWGFVTAWFGIPAPAGESIVRLRIYVSEEETAKYMTYINTKEGQKTLGVLSLPADAKPGDFVTVDVPVKAKEEWSGFTIKKADTSDKPSPWIDTLSIVLPD